LKSNILFKFAIDAHGIYKDNRNSMKVAAQELRVINCLVNEKSLNRLFIVPCVALITKCGLRMYASSVMPLNSQSMKYGCVDLSQKDRRSREVPLNSDCFSVFWDGTVQGRIQEEGHLRQLSESIYSSLIPELAHSIQSGRVTVKSCDEVKQVLHHHMLCLRHLPYLIEKVSRFDPLFVEAQHSFNFLLAEMLARILKWKVVRSAR